MLTAADTREKPTCGDRARRRGHGHVGYPTNSIWSFSPSASLAPARHHFGDARLDYP
jgi:hypothetical protein